MKVSDKIKISIGVVAVGVIAGVAAFMMVQPQIKPKQPDKENPSVGAMSDRFIVESSDNVGLSEYAVFRDTTTGEGYLFVKNGYGGGLTHLVEPKEVDEPEEEIIEVIFDNNYDNMIYQAAKDTDVDPYLAIAISRLETGHYTSTAFIEGNNFGGITIRGEVASFDSLASGLDRYVSLLGWYHRNGMTTAELMQSTYCPPNENWDEVVNEIYASLVTEVD